MPSRASTCATFRSPSHPPWHRSRPPGFSLALTLAALTAWRRAGLCGSLPSARCADGSTIACGSLRCLPILNCSRQDAYEIAAAAVYDR
eukprot:363169-Chlamydomonas_euryale.AAC.12